MQGEELSESWERARSHLARAWVELPSGSGDTNEYQEYLDHNELGLAMEALRDLGNLRGAHGQFWAALADAAEQMKLQQQAEEYRRRSRG
jgi:hypothetical protein